MHFERLDLASGASGGEFVTLSIGGRISFHELTTCGLLTDVHNGCREDKINQEWNGLLKSIMFFVHRNNPDMNLNIGLSCYNDLYALSNSS